ncbi:hypothetical protein OHD16_12415 [Sphingobacterium sp. ML3W]|uniref:carboxypeptidase-like regulatory domain-containing protein n=1 Tax=Sphingobacterium sp. ML3W TaxID=1538644 RepID=UPI00249B1AFA|nr:hypothetical protein [Sphingobacterium sp. ML3W]WFA80761.1 hypothetical protein OGI71_05560 [Sphingobacterium sp. ML3W]
MKEIFCSLCLTMVSTLTFAQEKIEGIISSNKQAIPYATIVIGYANSSLHTVRSNSTGQYVFNLTKEEMSKVQWIEVSHISYEKVRKDYKGQSPRVDFELVKKSIQLADVTVKSKPLAVRRAGDTTRYAVNNFVSAEDRNIGDVLRRMPGIEVDDNGVIKHNGKTVSRMYVDGDNIFQNGYGVGTRTIQPKAVKDVELVQNHEHKKVKQGVSNSEDVALNLVLNEDAKMIWSGEATVGIAAPIDGFINGNAMSFKKKYKTLNTLQYNSIGERINNDVESINSFNLTEPIAAATPSVPTNKYYNNRSVAFNTNQFYKWSEAWSSSVNGNLWADREQLSSDGTQRYLLADGSQVTYNNYYNTTKKPLYGRGSFTLEGNDNRYYLKNIIDFKAENQNHHTWLLDDGARYDQWGRDQLNFISESMEYTPKLKNKDLITFNLDLAKKWHKDRLEVFPGVMANYLNENQPYDAVRQTVSLPQTNGNIQVAYTRNNTRLKRTYFARLNYLNKELNSALDLVKDGAVFDNKRFPDNNLRWQQQQMSAGVKLDWKNKDFILSGAFPLTWNAWDITDRHAGSTTETKKLLFTPSVSLQAYLPNRDYFLLSLRFNQENSDLDQLYPYPILSNFREIKSFAAPLYFTSNQAYTLRYAIERPISLFYLNVTASHLRTQNDYLVGQDVTQHGIISKLMPYDNRTSSNALTLGMSKSLLKEGIYLGLNASANQNKYNQFLNGQFAAATGTTITVSPRLEYKGISHTTLSYQYTYSDFRNRLKSEAERSSNQYTSNTHSLGMLYVVGTYLFVKGTWSYGSYQSSGLDPIANGFLDASIRYKPLKSKHSLELNINNILNKKIYSSYSLTPNLENRQTIPLRGFQSVLKYSFLF